MIINTDEIKNIYISSRYVDMRKSIDWLALIVHSQFQMNVLDHSLFIFTNRAKNRIKILYYENNVYVNLKLIHLTEKNQSKSDQFFSTLILRHTS